MNDFYPRMSLEDYGYILNENEIGKIALPMICFCDIPLHLISSHMEEYGHFGIGLKKSWGIENGLNPVLYLKRETYLNEVIIKINEYLVNLKRQNKSKFEMNLMWNLLAFIKPYEGISHKNGKNKVFYDEREWRYFPNFFESNNIDANIPLLFEKDFNTIKKDNLNNYLKRFPLKYEPSDIKYIIVKDEEDIYLMSKIIDEIKSDKYTQKDIQILKTKIISSNYMLEDF